jgi:hypothetical protein
LKNFLSENSIVEYFLAIFSESEIDANSTPITVEIEVTETEIGDREETTEQATLELVTERVAN